MFGNIQKKNFFLAHNASPLKENLSKHKHKTLNILGAFLIDSMHLNKLIWVHLAPEWPILVTYNLFRAQCDPQWADT